VAIARTGKKGSFLQRGRAKPGQGGYSQKKKKQAAVKEKQMEKEGGEAQKRRRLRTSMTSGPAGRAGGRNRGIGPFASSKKVGE